jgi:hypothetical protein
MYEKRYKDMERDEAIIAPPKPRMVVAYMYETIAGYYFVGHYPMPSYLKAALASTNPSCPYYYGLIDVRLLSELEGRQREDC